jgi:hypothetical protein
MLTFPETLPPAYGSVNFLLEFASLMPNVPVVTPSKPRSPILQDEHICTPCRPRCAAPCRPSSPNHHSRSPPHLRGRVSSIPPLATSHRFAAPLLCNRAPSSPITAPPTFRRSLRTLVRRSTQREMSSSASGSSSRSLFSSQARLPPAPDAIVCLSERYHLLRLQQGIQCWKKIPQLQVTGTVRRYFDFVSSRYAFMSTVCF